MEISILPRWIVRYFSKDFLCQNDLNILLSNLLIIFTFLLFRNVLMDFLSFIPHFCLIDRLFGIECPVCGTTRAFCELSKGNLNSAYSLNFSSLFVALFFILQIPLRLFSIIVGNIHQRINLISKYIGNAILIMILVVWIVKLITNIEM
jgi:hypothetical protein